MDNIKFYIDGHETSITTNTATINKLKNDDDFVYNFIIKAIKNDKIQGIDKNETDIIIERVDEEAVEPTDDDTESEVKINASNSEVRNTYNFCFCSRNISKYCRRRLYSEELISHVQERPGLYDFRLPISQRTKNIKDKLWKEIADAMNNKASVETLAKKWKTLRDYYIKIRGEIRNKPPSGSGVCNKESRKIWKFYHIMTFLDDALESRQTTSNMDKPVCTTLGTTSFHRECNITTDDDKSCDNTKIKSKKRKTDCLDNQNNLQKIEELIKAPICIENNTSSLDGTDHFCVRLAEGLKKLPSYRARSELEIHMLQKLNEYMINYNIE